MRTKTHRCLCLLLVLGSISACKKPAQIEEVRPVRTEKVSMAPAVLTATYSGEIKARREIELGFQVSGRVQKRLVEVGQEVQVGTTLFLLDPADQLLSANASQSQVEAARSQLAAAGNEYKRFSELLESRFVSQNDYEQKRLAFQAAQQSLKAAQANYSLSANQSAYTTLRSTAAGVITSLSAESGQVVQAGQAVATVAQTGERELLISIPESRIHELETASSMSVELWSAPGKRYAAKLRELAPDTDSVTRTYAARITILEASDSVGLGMTGKLLVSLPDPHPGLVRVPITAIYDPDGSPSVWIVDPKTSRVTQRKVGLLRTDTNGVLVRSGLKNADVVVTAGVNLLHDQQKVVSVDAATMPGPRS